MFDVQHRTRYDRMPYLAYKYVNRQGFCHMHRDVSSNASPALLIIFASPCCLVLYLSPSFILPHFLMLKNSPLMTNIPSCAPSLQHEPTVHLLLALVSLPPVC